MAETQSYQHLVPQIARYLGLENFPEKWSKIDVVLPLLERMREDGAVVIIKFDGGRTSLDDVGPYTIHISGPALKGDYVRTDENSLEAALAYGIVQYARFMWSFKG